MKRAMKKVGVTASHTRPRVHLRGLHTLSVIGGLRLLRRLEGGRLQEEEQPEEGGQEEQEEEEQQAGEQVPFGSSGCHQSRCA